MTLLSGGGCGEPNNGVMERTPEAGLVGVFRLFAGIELGWLVVVTAFVGVHPHPPHPPVAMVVMLATATLLLLYLLVPGLERRIGRAFLPLAIALCAAVPLAGLATAVASDPTNLWDLGKDVFVLPLFPLLLIAWQFGFKAVVGFVVAATLADGVIALFAQSLFDWEAEEYFRLVGIRGAAMLCIGYIITRLMKEQRAQREKLRATNAELHRLGAVREQLATSRERNRVARELHDTLAHTLTGLAVQLEALRTVWDSDAGEARDLLEKAHASARSGLVETRRALAALRASPLDSVGLVGAVRALAEEASARGGLRLELALPEGDVELDEDDAQALYRVAQEALENVVRHADARRVSVSLLRDGPVSTLVVADDGRGFDLAPCASGCWGLAGMRERAEARGAALDVESRPGAGTIVRLRLGAVSGSEASEER